MALRYIAIGFRNLYRKHLIRVLLRVNLFELKNNIHFVMVHFFLFTEFYLNRIIEMIVSFFEKTDDPRNPKW